MEHNSRRSFPKVWAQISDKKTNKFYHQNEIDSQLSDQLKLKGKCPFRFTNLLIYKGIHIDLCSFLHNNQGECIFVSPEMYQNLLAVCRCGRARQGHHVGKCLQRALSPDYERSGIQKSPQESYHPLRVPCTSNCKFWFQI